MSTRPSFFCTDDPARDRGASLCKISQQRGSSVLIHIIHIAEYQSFVGPRAFCEVSVRARDVGVRRESFQFKHRERRAAMSKKIALLIQNGTSSQTLMSHINLSKK